MIVEYLPQVGQATECTAAHAHAPKPLRYVWHHILPRACGGQTIAANLAQVCDNCHYGIHVLLRELAINDGTLTTHKHMAGTERHKVALQGYWAAVTAGTVSQIPNEGSD